MSKIRFNFVLKGGKGSGHHGHAGRPGQVGGSVPEGEGGGGGEGEAPQRTRPEGSYWPKNEVNLPRGMSVYNWLRHDKDRGLIDHTAIVMNAKDAGTLAKTKASYGDDEDSGYFLVHAYRGGRKPRRVRLMGYFQGQQGIPQPGDRIGIALDNGEGKYKIVYGDVIEDDGGRATLWHYD